MAGEAGNFGFAEAEVRAMTIFPKTRFKRGDGRSSHIDFTEVLLLVGLVMGAKVLGLW